MKKEKIRMIQITGASTESFEGIEHLYECPDGSIMIFEQDFRILNSNETSNNFERCFSSFSSFSSEELKMLFPEIHELASLVELPEIIIPIEDCDIHCFFTLGDLLDAGKENCSNLITVNDQEKYLDKLLAPTKTYMDKIDLPEFTANFILRLGETFKIEPKPTTIGEIMYVVALKFKETYLLGYRHYSIENINIKNSGEISMILGS